MEVIFCPSTFPAAIVQLRLTVTLEETPKKCFLEVLKYVVFAVWNKTIFPSLI